MKRGTVAILSVDGGGVRGLIPAMLIRDILRRVRFLKQWTGRRDEVAVHRLFDIFAGTSTGALLTLGMVQPSPLSPEEIVRFYIEEAESIFPVGRFASVSAMRQAFAHKYDAAPFEAPVRRGALERVPRECPGHRIRHRQSRSVLLSPRRGRRDDA